ncbi:tRNA-dihydrouridine synthase [Patescibacteria group bacterium]|nr:tRNA-dihydrouridine synthase [Patescibacteria group bacterium]MBU1721783.1 tRNA-dihydrouridine synthase [Patescibacteria group bacterium]MBU1901378.1 tRNA-dihydrouridine synthase [Patescibacteria group bacterium]
MWFQNILDNNQKILALAPMADMTDSPFCQTVKHIGGCDIVFREMVSSEALVRDNDKTLYMTDFDTAERPIIQQIFGADPLTMAQAAVIVMERSHPDGIDINMGCPVHKITSNFNGCSLMRDADKAGEIVKEMKQAIGDTPLSVKIRLGWNDPDTFKTFIPVLEEAGAQLITVHGRTRAQGYSGVADWNRIAEAKHIATVPLLANGDVFTPELVSKALEVTGADGVMIGRGSLGNPWFFSLAKAGEGNESVSIEKRVQMILYHLDLHLAHYGEKGIVTFRKHLGWYMKSQSLGQNIPGIKQFRGQLVQASSRQEVVDILNTLH